MARELVTKENSLVAASYSLDLIEQRLILLSIALSRRTGLGLSAQKPLFITAQEFSSAYGSDVKNAYRQLKSATETLFDRQITYKDVVNGKRGVSRIRWVQKYSIRTVKVQLPSNFLKRSSPCLRNWKRTSLPITSMKYAISALPTQSGSLSCALGGRMPEKRHISRLGN